MTSLFKVPASPLAMSTWARLEGGTSREDERSHSSEPSWRLLISSEPFSIADAAPDLLEPEPGTVGGSE
jgi:hypothetical protein